MHKVESHTITLEAALTVASNLSEADRREIEEGWGQNVIETFTTIAKSKSGEYIVMPNGKTAALIGVEDAGIVWMVCTDDILDFPIAFARWVKGWVESRPEPLLWNYVDKRNTTHLNLLKFLGFKFLRELPFGPNQLSFIEFCRVKLF